MESSQSRKRKSQDEEDSSGKKCDGFEHLDHPADIQLHSWGPTMSKALENLVLSMYSYMVNLDTVEEKYPYYFTANGHDEDSLVFNVLNEPLVAFQSEPFFIGKRVEVESVSYNPFVVNFCAYGDSFDRDKHEQGADVKAITHSNMQIIKDNSRTNIYVIVDI